MRILQPISPTHVLRKGDSVFRFLEAGDVYEIMHGSVMINQLRGNPRDGAQGNVFLRIYERDGIRWHPMWGIRSKSRMLMGPDSICFAGSFRGVGYALTFHLAAEGLWFFQAALTGNKQTVDVVYAQDVGLADRDLLLEDELAAVRELESSVAEGENGYIVCAQQRKRMREGLPYLRQGMVQGRAVGYATSATQFYGLSYRVTNVPEALGGALPNEVVQNCLPFCALQSEKLVLDRSRVVTFYALSRKNVADAQNEMELHDEIQAAYVEYLRRSETMKPFTYSLISPEVGPPYPSPSWDEGIIRALYPRRSHEVREDGELVSFRTDSGALVAMQCRDGATELPTTAYFTPPEGNWPGYALRSEAYMYGSFNAATVFAKNSEYRLLARSRGLLNVLKNGGQRLYVRINGKYRILTAPAVFEMGQDYALWRYELPDGCLLVVTYRTVNENGDIVLEIEADKALDLQLVHLLVLGQHEGMQSIRMELLEDGVRLTPTELSCADPDIFYDLRAEPHCHSIEDDRTFFADNRTHNGTLLTLRWDETKRCKLRIAGGVAEGGSLENDRCARCSRPPRRCKHLAVMHADFDQELV